MKHAAIVIKDRLVNSCTISTRNNMYHARLTHIGRIHTEVFRTLKEAEAYRNQVFLTNCTNGTGYKYLSLSVLNGTMSVFVSMSTPTSNITKRYTINKRNFKESLRLALDFVCDTLEIDRLKSIDYRDTITTYNKLVHKTINSDLKLFKIDKCDVMAVCSTDDIPKEILKSYSSVVEIGRAKAGTKYMETF
jgi:hypothetical protein